MIGFEKTVTIYNQHYDPATRKTKWHRTVIPGTSWAGCQKVTTGEGLTSNDGYSVRIPVATMPDGYIQPDGYSGLSDTWTARNGDVVVLGESPEVLGSIAEITKRFHDCFTVIAAHSDNMTRLLPHLRIEGK